MPRIVSVVALALAALGGCRNACQATCKTMAEAATDCGFTVPEADIDACVERQSQAEREDVKACRANGPDNIQYSCDELSLYFGGGES
jgi:hypothetical protein